MLALDEFHGVLMAAITGIGGALVALFRIYQGVRDQCEHERDGWRRELAEVYERARAAEKQAQSDLERRNDEFIALLKDLAILARGPVLTRPGEEGK